MPTRVLIVEDSPTQAEALRALLDDAGYVVTLARNGEDGLARFGADKFDVVISDVVMPGAVDGYELCLRIKKDGRGDTPVVLLTSLSDPLDIIRGLESGADNFLTKPYEPTHLLERLRTLLATRATRGQAMLRMGVKVLFLGREFTITSEREQILDLLISTFEDAVRQNRELRHREEELRATKEELARYAGTLEQRLQSVLESVPDVLFSMDAGLSQWLYLSPACRTVFGFTPEELTADPGLWRRAIHPDDRLRYEKELAQVRLTGQPATIEYRLQHPDGSIRWIGGTCIPIADERGTLVRLDGIAHDITNERRLEEQLRLAQKMEAVGTLAGGVAHDFNNLLGVIKLSVDLALFGQQPSDPVREELGRIDEAVGRATALTRQLLAFGRKQVLEPRAVDLNALLAGTVKMLERLIGADVRLAQRQTSDAATVMADPGQVEQIVMNLCLNARDAMPRGGELALLTERLTIRDDFCANHSWARPGEFVVLTVSDTGDGMDAATQARMFEPFFTTKELGRGTGLGLAVVYGIVKQHGGLINVYSEPGKGTAFRIYLPFQATDPAAAATEHLPGLVGGTETILLADDNAALLAAATALLQRLGYRVLWAANGEEALEILAKEGDTVQLAVLDLQMPRIGGQEVFERARVRHPKLRFILSTGYSPDTAQMEPIRALSVEFLPKPYGLQALALAVRRALER
jgi:two-component system cell cycle sensor histidine kinase/response regulator CckA